MDPNGNVSVKTNNVMLAFGIVTVIIAVCLAVAATFVLIGMPIDESESPRWNNVRPRVWGTTSVVLYGFAGCCAYGGYILIQAHRESVKDLNGDVSVKTNNVMLAFGIVIVIIAFCLAVAATLVLIGMRTDELEWRSFVRQHANGVPQPMERDWHASANRVLPSPTVLTPINAPPNVYVTTGIRRISPYIARPVVNFGLPEIIDRSATV